MYAPRRNWDSPQPPTRLLVCPLPPVSGGRGTLAGEKGVGRVPIPTRGIHCGTVYMYVLCDLDVRLVKIDTRTNFSSVEDPDPDFYPSLIPDLTTATKEQRENCIVVISFFVATNFLKLKIIFIF